MPVRRSGEPPISTPSLLAGLAGPPRHAPGSPALDPNVLSALLAPPQPPPPELNPFLGFLGKVLTSATIENIGIEPPRAIQRFEAEHPIASLGAELLGFALPATAALKASRALRVGERLASRIPAFARALESQSAFVRGAAKEVPFLATLEVPRLAGSIVAEASGEEGAFKRTLESVAAESAIVLGGGGALRAIGEFSRTRSARSRTLQGLARLRQQLDLPEDLQFSLDEPPQTILQKLSRAEREGVLPDDEVLRSIIEEERPKLIARAMKEEIPKGAYSKIRGRDPQGLRELAKKGNLLSERESILRGLPKTWRAAGADIGKIERILTDLSDPERLAHIRFPRVLTARTARDSERIIARLERSGLRRAGRGDVEVYLGRDVRGRIHAAVRVSPVPRKARTPMVGDVFVVFQSDDIASALKGLVRFPSRVETQGLSFLESVRRVTQRPPPPLRRNPVVQSIEKVASLTEGAVRVRPPEPVPTIARLGPAGQATEETVRGLARQLLGPALTKYVEHPEAVRLRTLMQVGADSARATADVLIFGRPRFRYRNLIRDIATGAIGRQGGIGKDVLEVFTRSEDDYTKFVIALNEGMSPNEARAALGLSPKAVSILRKLDEIDNSILPHVEAAYAFASEGLPFTPRKFHYLFSRQWIGDYRVRIRKPNAGTIAIGAGRTPKQAREAAEDIVRALREQGIEAQAERRGGEILVQRRRDLRGDLELAEEILRNASSEDMHKIRAAMRRNYLPPKLDPLRFNPRHGVLGFRTDLRPNELLQVIHQNLTDSLTLVADRYIRTRFSDVVNRIAEDAPDLARILAEDYAILYGRRAPLDAALVEWLENTKFGEIFGFTTAERVARRLNNIVFQLTLGFADLGFALLNAMTLLQTGAPEIAFVLSGARAAESAYAGMLIDVGGKKALASVFDPFRLIIRGFKRMARPDNRTLALFKRAATEGVISKPFVEAFLGQRSQFSNIELLRKGAIGFLDYFDNIASTVAARSEEFTRGWSFMVGLETGEMLGLEGERLYRFAARFTDRTNFLYGAADRPRIFSGPFGSVLGLFKTWPIHMASNMLLYANAALRERQVAPFLYLMGSSLVMGGAAATPFVGVADGVSRLATDRSLRENLFLLLNADEEEPSLVADALWYGMPSLFGITLSTRAEIPGAHLLRNVNDLWSIALFSRMRLLGDVAGDVALWMRHGVVPPTLGRKLAAAVLPRSIYRGLEALDGEIRAIGTGTLVADDVSALERMLLGLGIQPLRLQKLFDVRNELWRDLSKRRAAVSLLGRAYAEAMLKGDFDATDQLIDRAIALGIGLDTLARSAHAHARARLIAPPLRMDPDRALELLPPLVGEEETRSLLPPPPRSE